MTENINKLIEYRFQQACETFTVSEELFANSHYRDAVNRAYYAMFYCSLGLLAAKNLGTSKHSGVLSLFSRYFVKPGLVSVETGRYLREAFELRQNCDYREFVEITQQQAKEIIDKAKTFIAESEQTLLRDVFDSYFTEMQHCLQRLDSLEKEVTKLAESEPYKTVVGFLRCFHGIDTLTAITMLTEIFEFGRFSSPGQLMSYLGLTCSEDSSGQKQRKGSITKAGNKRIRRLLVGFIWSVFKEYEIRNRQRAA